MCAHYENIRSLQVLTEHFGVEGTELGRADVWSGYAGVMVRRHPQADVGDEAVPEREALVAQFGLVPRWARDAKFSRHTYNARSETVASKPSFREAWHQARHCIVPVQAIYEPDWRSGKAVATRIARADGQPMGLAGLWDTWRAPDGAWLHSFTLLTIHADAHPLMNRFHKPQDEKRMVVILPEAAYADWLSAPARHSAGFLQPYPAQALVAMGIGT